MAQRLGQGEEERARYFSPSDHRQDRELHRDDSEMHARAPAAGSVHIKDGGNAW